MTDYSHQYADPQDREDYMDGAVVQLGMRLTKTPEDAQIAGDFFEQMTHAGFTPDMIQSVADNIAKYSEWAAQELRKRLGTSGEAVVSK